MAENEDLRWALGQHRDGEMDEATLRDFILDTFHNDPGWAVDTKTGLPDSPVWDVVEGTLSSRRDLLLRLREAVVG